MSDNKLEQYKLRDRNAHSVINQIIETYNASNGWALKKVVQNFNNLEVYLERSTDQSPDSKTTKEVKDEKVEAKSSEKVETTVPEKATTVKGKKASSSVISNEVKEAKKL